MTIADWLRNRNYPEFKDGVLVFPPVAVECAGCHGQLVGDEIRFGTCGHCRRGYTEIPRKPVCAQCETLHPHQVCRGVSSRPGEFTKDRP